MWKKILLLLKKYRYLKKILNRFRNKINSKAFTCLQTLHLKFVEIYLFDLGQIKINKHEKK